MKPANGMISIRISQAFAADGVRLPGSTPSARKLDDVVCDGEQDAGDGEEFGHEELPEVGVGRAHDSGTSAPPSCDTRAAICTYAVPWGKSRPLTSA